MERPARSSSMANTVQGTMDGALVACCGTLMDVLHQELLHASLDPCHSCGGEIVQCPFPKNDIPKVIRKRITKYKDAYNNDVDDEVDLAFLLKRDIKFLEKCRRVITLLNIGTYKPSDVKRKTILLTSILDMMLMIESHS